MRVTPRLQKSRLENATVAFCNRNRGVSLSQNRRLPSPSSIASPPELVGIPIIGAASSAGGPNGAKFASSLAVTATLGPAVETSGIVAGGNPVKAPAASPAKGKVLPGFLSPSIGTSRGPSSAAGSHERAKSPIGSVGADVCTLNPIAGGGSGRKLSSPIGGYGGSPLISGSNSHQLRRCGRAASVQ